MYAVNIAVIICFLVANCLGDHLRNECIAHCNKVPTRTESICSQDCHPNGCLMRCMKTGRKFGPCLMNCGLDVITIPQRKEEDNDNTDWFERTHDSVYESICLAADIKQCVCILDCTDTIGKDEYGEEVAEMQYQCRNGCGVTAVAG